MATTARQSDVLFFHCGSCQTELSVPAGLQGITGPCPICGQMIQAPMCPVPVQPSVYLPPLDGMPDASQPIVTGLPSPHETAGWDRPVDWSGYKIEDWTVVPVDGQAGPVDSREDQARKLPSRGGRGVPEGLAGFEAKLAIPPSEEPLDESWRQRHMEERRKIRNLKNLDKKATKILESQAFRVMRMVLLVGSGGLCAGLALYLKDRNWALELPWRPDAAPVVKSPRSQPAVTPAPASWQTPDPAEPFMVDEPSELEAVTRPLRPGPAPVPGPVTVPVGAKPVASAASEKN